MGNVCNHEPHELSIKSLRVKYGDYLALQKVSFEICCHHCLALVGPNGAGKSTLIKAIAGLVDPIEGSIMWRGQPLTANQRELAYLPQIDNHQKNFPITVREVVEMGRYPHIGMFGKFAKEDRFQVDKAIELMHLESFVDKQIDELSGGQQQRAFIARALAQEAHVVMLDEPFNGLDSQSRQDLAKTFDTLKANGQLVIASHHNLDNVEQLFDHILVLDGEQKDFGRSQEVMSRYRTRNREETPC